jgi:hypothetical protein
MATNAAGQRYRAWYAMLLRLYPRPFRERFGEGMAQTFHDLCREHRDARRGLFGLALWIFFETSVGIVKENTTHMPQLGKTMLRVALGALAALMVPLVASQVVQGRNWNAGGFVFAYVLFFATGMAYALIARKMDAWAYKAAVGLALVTGFVMGWSNMVHISESENPANFLYFGVLVVGAVGAWLARLEPRGMARSLFAMAATLAVLGVLVVTLFPEPSSGLMGRMTLMRGVFVALFIASGLLFRHASLAELK